MSVKSLFIITCDSDNPLGNAAITDENFSLSLGPNLVDGLATLTYNNTNLATWNYHAQGNIDGGFHLAHDEEGRLVE